MGFRYADGMNADDPLLAFESRAAFRAWLAEHSESTPVLWILFYKKASDKPTVTYEEAVEESLCFGWIDGVRYPIDAESFRQRFTPRTAKSRWSAVNIRRAESLIERGLMTEAGLREFAKRDGDAANYSYEQRREGLAPEYEAQFKADPAAWAFFEAQAPWYKRTAGFWVMDAKREETRQRRLQTLIADSAANRRIGPLSRPQPDTR
jgi:uncharacterized protein YdeI (YjbR/CyaY-like superfamily)